MKRRASIVILCAIASSVAHAGLWNLSATLNGASENPPNASLATGSFSATLDDVTGVLNGSMTYAGLAAAASASHIHGPASPVQNGPVMVPIPLNPAGLTSGTTSFSLLLNVGQVNTVLSGFSYVNIHNSVFPGGEIRGQILATSVPGPMAAMPFAAGLLLAMKRRKRRV